MSNEAITQKFYVGTLFKWSGKSSSVGCFHNEEECVWLSVSVERTTSLPYPYVNYYLDLPN